MYADKRDHQFDSGKYLKVILMSQIFLDKNNFGEQLLQLLKPFRKQCIMLVAGKSYKKLPIHTTIEQVIETLEIDLIRFSAFSKSCTQII